MAGDTEAVATVSVTGTASGVAPVAFTVTVALYFPAAKAPVFTVSVTAPFPVPKAGLSVNHEALPTAVQLSVPSPVLLMFKV
jgi:hypothetical protein